MIQQYDTITEICDQVVWYKTSTLLYHKQQNFKGRKLLQIFIKLQKFFEIFAIKMAILKYFRKKEEHGP